MRITKYEHACFVVEENGQSLIVDPGGFTTDLVVPDSTVAVVITHEHADHLDTTHLQEIVARNPDVTIIAHEEVVKQLNDFKTMAVVADEQTVIGNFELEFFGGQHAVIAPEWPTIANLGVLINKRLYYPGDSFTVPPERDVEILALPVAAPWLKISETMEFLSRFHPKLVFPTHDAILSDAGKGLPDRMLPPVAQNTGAEYRRLSEPVEL